MKELPTSFVNMVNKLENAYVATASDEGQPHIAVERGLSVDQGDLVFNSWFCPKTVENLRDNPLIVVSFWDKDKGKGYQLEGRKEELQEVAMLNGYPEGLNESQYPRPNTGCE